MNLINIAIILSVILNGALLAYMFGILPFLLFVSIIVNFILVYYAVRTITQNNTLNEDLQLLYDEIVEFTDHLENLHSLEMYYGDQNLQNLIDHSRQLINGIIDFQVEYSDAEVEIEPDTDKEEETTETEE